MRRTLILVALVSLATFIAAQQPSTSPDNESRTPVTVRSLNSIGSDLAVPLCPQHFSDSLAHNGVAAPNEKGVSSVRIKTTVPALTTQQAIDASGNTHIGNFTVIVNVLVDTKGVPHDLCLQKSSGYGLDASAAAAVAQYRFDPARKGEKPVRARVPVEIRFLTSSPPQMGQPRLGLPPK
jgi:protein TonB